MRLREQVSFTVGGAALLVSVLCVGGALRWTQASVAVLLGCAVGCHLLARGRLERVSPLLVLIGLAIVLTAIQLVPVPAALREVLVSRGDALRNDGAAIAGTNPWPSLSLDAASTLRSLAFLVVLFGVALVALRFSTTERGRFIVLAAVACTCALAAAITGIHVVFDAGALFGIYEPVHASPPVLGPLLNSNHLGSLMSVGAVLSLGLAFHSRQPVQLRVLWILGAIGCILVALATASRGAALALLFGVAVTGTLIVANRLSSNGRTRRRAPLLNEVPIAIVFTLGIGTAIYTSAGKVADQIDSTSIAELDNPASKYAAWRSSFELVGESPLVGIGRGALEPVFTRVHRASAQVTFSHLENEYVQAVVEWGVPGALILMLAFGWCVATAVRKWRDGALTAGALGALAAVLFQSTVDFGVELLGVAVPVTVIAATLLVVPLREGPSAALRALRGLVIAALIGAAIVLVLPVTTTIQEDHDAVAMSNHPTLADLHDVIERHPLDYYAFGQTASLLARNGDGRAVRYLNHALILHPTHPGLHRLAARMLASGKRYQQAAIELELAMAGTPHPHNLLQEVVAMLPSPDVAALAIPTDAAHPELIERSLRELSHTDILARWLQRVVAQRPGDIELIDRLYGVAMERRDLTLAEQAARARFAIANTPTSRLMLAKVMFARREYDELLKLLVDVAAWRGRLDEQTDAWLLVCDVHIERAQWDDALQCLHRLDGSGVSSSRRDLIVARIKRINDVRTIEAKQHALDALDHASPR